MAADRACGPLPGRFYTYKELPIGAVSIGIHADVIRTGLWRLFRPVITLKRPPCSDACPAGVDVRGVVSLMQKGLFEEACALYIEENPFPALCGRVCFHPCESACNRREFDEAVAINVLERFLADFAPLRQPDCATDGGRVAVVGSGPAGLSCAYFLRLLGHFPTVFEARPVAGGKLRTAIPSYRLPKETLERELTKLANLGIEFKTGLPLAAGGWNEVEPFDAVFLALGAGVSRNLPVAGPGSAETISGLELLEAVNLGKKVILGNSTVVIGGGNAAIDAARTALRLGSKPLVIYRRSAQEMPASCSEVADAHEEGVEILYLTTPVRITKPGLHQSGLGEHLPLRKALRIECVKNRLEDPENDGRRRPIPVEGSDFALEADSVIVAVGELPNFDALPRVLQPTGPYLPVDEFGRTLLPKVFAGGDAAGQQHTVAHAIGSGKKAALAIDRFLRGRAPEDRSTAAGARAASSVSFRAYKEGKPSGERETVISFSDLNRAYFSYAKRSVRPKLPVEARSGFREIYGNLTSERAIEEASRCLSCGQCCQCSNCVVFCPDESVHGDEKSPFQRIDYAYCKGCGICANECPVGAIDMEREE